MQNLEIRTSRESNMGFTEADGNTLSGYIAVFNSQSVPMGFVEVLAPGCFTRSLEDPSEDIVALINHDDDAPVGRLSTGTLKLNEDTTGLAFSLDLPETTRANDLKVNIARGDVKGCSFGFVCREDSWEQKPDGSIVRTLLDVDLYEVSVGVTFPAYTDTTAQLRSNDPALRMAPQEIRSRLESKESPATPNTEPEVVDTQAIQDHIEATITLLRLK